MPFSTPASVSYAWLAAMISPLAALSWNRNFPDLSLLISNLAAMAVLVRLLEQQKRYAPMACGARGAYVSDDRRGLLDNYFLKASLIFSPASLTLDLAWSLLPSSREPLSPVMLPTASLALPLTSCALFFALSVPLISVSSCSLLIGQCGPTSISFAIPRQPKRPNATAGGPLPGFTRPAVHQ